MKITKKNLEDAYYHLIDTGFLNVYRDEIVLSAVTCEYLNLSIGDYIDFNYNNTKNLFITKSDNKLGFRVGSPPDSYKKSLRFTSMKLCKFLRAYYKTPKGRIKMKILLNKTNYENQKSFRLTNNVIIKHYINKKTQNT